MLFEFCIKVLENSKILCKYFKELIMIHLVRIVSSSLQLVVLLAEALIKLWHLLLVIFTERSLLLVDYFINLGEEVLLIPIHVHFALSKNLAHELR